MCGCNLRPRGSDPRSAGGPVKPPKTKDTSGGKKTNKWIAHLQQFRSENPDMPYREAMKQAKLTYVKNSK